MSAMDTENFTEPGAVVVEQHLQRALAHMAAAEALAEVYGCEGRVGELAGKIAAKTTIFTDGVVEAVPLHVIAAEPEPDEAEPVAAVAEVAVIDEPAPLPLSEENSTPTQEDQPATKLRKKLDARSFRAETAGDFALPTPSPRLESEPAEHTIQIVKDCVLRMPNGEYVALSSFQAYALSSLLLNRGKWLNTDEINPSKIGSFSQALDGAARKISGMGIPDELIEKEGRRRNLLRRLNPKFDFVDVRQPDIDDSGDDTGVIAEAQPDHQTITPDRRPSARYAENLGNSKARRNGIIQLTNIAEINAWVRQESPYGSLPTVRIIDDRQITIDERKPGFLSDDHRELLNLLLANHGHSLTKDQILAAGFAEYLGSNGQRQRHEVLEKTIKRFGDIHPQGSDEHLVMGDLEKGIYLNQGFLIKDERKIVKKK